MAAPHSTLTRKIVGAYVFWAALWILLSDRVLVWCGLKGEGWAWLESAKGLFFVVVTGGLLHELVRRMMGRLDRAEAAWRDQEARWRLALEAVGDGLWEVNPVTRQAYFSPGWKAMLGHGEDDAEPTLATWQARIHAQDIERVERELERCLTGEAPTYRCEYRLRNKDGGYRWILARGGLVTEGDGSGGRLVGTHSDITSRKHNEARIADTLAFTKAVLHCSPTGIIAFKAAGEAVIANESAARILGTEVAALLKQNFRELPAWRDAGLLAAADQALGTGREVEHTGALATGAGSSLWIEAHLVPFEYEEEPHLLLLLKDETGEHSALDQLRLMQAAAQAAPVGWVVTDAAGRIEWVNPAFTALTGYGGDEVVGANPRLLKSGRQPPEYYKAMWAAIRRGEVWSGELINRRKDGSHYHEFNTIAPVRDKGGAITHYVAIKQDISARKQLEGQLARTQRLESIGQLACGMVHDLNNMLAPIMLSLGMIRAQHADPETQAYVQMMENAAQRGAGVLRQVLTFAQGVEGERQLLEPKHLLKEIAQLTHETFSRQIRVATEVHPAVSLVSGDVTQLHQVLLNLAVNARDAMPEGGVLTLYAGNTVVDEIRAARQVTPAKPGTYVALGVRDTGAGIPAEVLEHMFEPFYTTKPRGKGTGLGLSTVFGIVRSYGGFIEVDTVIGQGTDIRVLLPAVARTTGTERPFERPAVTLDGAGRKILVVEDEPTVRAVTAQVLAQHGFVVEVAEDGLDGLAKFIADPNGFSGVITDLMMPKMNGCEFAREVRWRAPNLPILASSGLSSDSPASGEKEAEVLEKLGVRTVLPKPYTEAQLLVALAAELEKKRDERL